jgi:hypothetical protein
MLPHASRFFNSLPELEKKSSTPGALPPVSLPALLLFSGRADQRLNDVVGSTSNISWLKVPTDVSGAGP